MDKVKLQELYNMVVEDIEKGDLDWIQYDLDRLYEEALNEDDSFESVAEELQDKVYMLENDITDLENEIERLSSELKSWEEGDES